MKHVSVYILLSRSGTMFSRAIHTATSATGNYTHASLCVQVGDTPHIYSFARRYPRLPLPAGMIREDGPAGFFALHPETPCALYKLELPNRVSAKVLAIVDKMFQKNKKYRYSIIGTALCGLDIAHERRYYYFCSQFVADVLEKAGALSLPKEPSLMMPTDYEHMPELKQVYQGPVGGILPLGDDWGPEGLEYVFPPEAAAI